MIGLPHGFVLKYRRTVTGSERSIEVTGGNSGIGSTGDGTINIQIGQLKLLGAPLPAIGEVRATAAPVGVPGTGLFVGRERELERLAQALDSGGTVVVQAVHGLGGVGKSSLVARYVELYARHYTQVVWITATDAVSLAAGLADFAVALEPHLAGVMASAGLQERAVGWLCEHEGWLVVLDNVTEPGDVRKLVARAARGRFVITSRRSVGWHGIARPMGLDVLAAEEARDLVADMLGPDLARLSAGVDELCEYLGFLPLAVEQAAAFMAQSQVGASEYLRLLRAHPGVMLGAAAEGTGRTIAQVWAVTLNRLANDPWCGNLLRILAWFAPQGISRRFLGGLTPEPEIVRALGRLAAYSMITLDEEQITVHRLVQAVARTPDEHDPHRAPSLVDDARNTAIGLLRWALPEDPYAPAEWPQWRELAGYVAVFTEHAAEDTDTSEMSRFLNAVAQFMEDQGAVKQAITLFERTLRLDERTLGPDHESVWVARHNLASAYCNNGDHARAIPLFEQALTDHERVLGPNHPDTLMCRNSLAFAYDNKGDLERAITLYEQTLADCERVLGPDHLTTLLSRNNLAHAYSIDGALDRAIPLYEQTLADREHVLGPDHPDTLVSRNNLAAAYNRNGDLERATPLYKQSLTDCERVLGPNHPHTLMSRNNLAYAYSTGGALDRAIPLYEQTLAGCERVLGPEHPRTELVRANLAACRTKSQ
jgi:tetratricopeptide (TPR) repeat protein